MLIFKNPQESLSNQEIFDQIEFQKQFEMEHKKLEDRIQEKTLGLRISEEKFFSLNMLRRRPIR